MRDLSKQSVQLIDMVFFKDDRPYAIDILQQADIPLCEDKPDCIERVTFAAIKFSSGSIDRLRHAVALAQEDWRDLLVFSGFDRDTNSHMKWAKERLG